MGEGPPGRPAGAPAHADAAAAAYNAAADDVDPAPLKAAYVAANVEARAAYLAAVPDGDTFTAVTTALAADGTEQVITREPVTLDEWSARQQRRRVDLVTLDGVVVDSYETTAGAEDPT